MNKFNEYFPNVVVLGTTDGHYREQLIRERFSKNNINQFEIYKASKLPIYKHLFEALKSHATIKTGWKNFKHPDELAITVGHLNIIRMAKDNNWDSVFIFENDSTFLKDFDSTVDNYLESIPENWDMLYFAITVDSQEKIIPVNDYWFKPKGFCTLASAYVIKNTLYDEILNFYEDDYYVIDLYYAFFLQQHEKYNTYATNINLCAQNRATDIHKDYNQMDVFDMSINFGNYTIEDYE